MARWRLLVCVAVVFFSCASVSAQSVERVLPSDRVTTFLNIRRQPDADSPIASKLQVGESLELIRNVPRWYEVRLPDGTTGFVSKAWSTVTHGLQARKEDELRIHYLNIGAGTCTIVQCPGPNAPPLIVDCGSTGATANDMNETEAAAYIQGILKESDLKPNVVISHGDLDHYGYLPTVLKDIEVGNIWQGGASSEYSSAEFPKWIASQQSEGATVHRNFARGWHNDGDPIGSSLSCGLANTYVLTVNVRGQNPNPKNAKSLVLMVEYGEFTAVFTGDAEGTTEASAIQNFEGALKASVVTASHHGAATWQSNSKDWSVASSPDVVVHTAGDKHKHPTCTAMNRFTTVASTKAHPARCGDSDGYRTFQTKKAHFMTERVGTVIVTSDGHSPMWLHCTRSAACGVKIPH